MDAHAAFRQAAEILITESNELAQRSGEVIDQFYANVIAGLEELANQVKAGVIPEVVEKWSWMFSSPANPQPNKP